MDIKRAKQEIEHTIQAYLSKDEYEEYQIPLFQSKQLYFSLESPPRSIYLLSRCIILILDNYKLSNTRQLNQVFYVWLF